MEEIANYLAGLFPVKQIYFSTVYPVGSLYMSTSATNPSSYFSGTTWEAFSVGRTFIGVDPNDTAFNAANKTGGEKTHRLTTDEIPSHTHSTRIGTGSGPYSYNVQGLPVGADASTTTTGATGGGQAHNNLPPYVTCYIWRRTA